MSRSNARSGSGRGGRFLFGVVRRRCVAVVRSGRWSRGRVIVEVWGEGGSTPADRRADEVVVAFVPPGAASGADVEIAAPELSDADGESVERVFAGAVAWAAVRSPRSLLAAKRLVALRGGWSAEREAFVELFGCADRSEGIAAFLEKRRPDFSPDRTRGARRPKSRRPPAPPRG